MALGDTLVPWICFSEWLVHVVCGGEGVFLRV
jgi:hypothetical protein